MAGFAYSIAFRHALNCSNVIASTEAKLLVLICLHMFQLSQITYATRAQKCSNGFGYARTFGNKLELGMFSEEFANLSLLDLSIFKLAQTNVSVYENINVWQPSVIQFNAEVSCCDVGMSCSSIP